jgi:peptidoglycan/LPS O-acetylase OafA/YrhL
MQFFFGLFLADLQNHAPAIEWTNARSWTKYYLAPLLMVLGLYFASYPEEHQEWMPWSHSLHLFSQYLLPEDYDHPRFFTGLGLECITLAIHFSPMLKDLLANRYFLWLGKQSFAVYLIHGTLLRTLLTWMVYGVRTPRPVQNEDGVWQAGEVLKVKSWPMLVVHIPLFFVILYSLAMIWVKYVDSACARWTESLVKYVQREDQNEKLPVVGRKEDGERLPR